MYSYVQLCTVDVMLSVAASFISCRDPPGDRGRRPDERDRGLPVHVHCRLHRARRLGQHERRGAHSRVDYVFSDTIQPPYSLLNMTSITS